MSVASKHNYLNKDILNLKSTVIREYDMKDAGFTIIKNEKLFDKDTIMYLNSLSKKNKNITIGKMLRDNQDVSSAIMDKFVEIRESFITKNNISDSEVLSVKKDAIITINKLADVLEIDGYTFANKNKYSSYMYLNQKEFYYSSWDDTIDVKGLGKHVLSSHEKFLLKDIRQFMKHNETLDNNNLMKLLKSYRRKYLAMQLPLDTYREMNFENLFKLKITLADQPVYIDGIDESVDLRDIDTVHNYINYIIPMIGLII